METYLVQIVYKGTRNGGHLATHKVQAGSYQHAYRLVMGLYPNLSVADLYDYYATNDPYKVERVR